MPAAVQPLPRGKIKEAVATLTRAFAHDPIFNHYFPDSGDRARVFTVFFNDVIRANLGSGHVYCALDGDRMIGAAVWHPPGAGAPRFRDRLRSAVAAWQVRQVSKGAAINLFAGFETLEALHPQRSHWHLMFIGVDKSSRMQHAGSHLMAPVLSLADKRGEVCYLETPFPDTHAFYQRLGFKITLTCNPFPCAPTIWTMTREPGAATGV